MTGMKSQNLGFSEEYSNTTLRQGWELEGAEGETERMGTRGINEKIEDYKN